MGKYFNLVKDQIKATYGISLRKNQIAAIKNLLRGKIVSLPTGEGKTIVGVAAVAIKALMGERVIITFPNPYLAKRDCDYANRLLMELGFKGELIDSNEMSSSQKFYAKIIYCPSDTLVFSYLGGAPIDFDSYLIMDEIDYTLVESANHTLNVSTQEDGFELNTFDYKLAMTIAEGLEGYSHQGILSSEHHTLIEVDEKYDYYAHGPNLSMVSLTGKGIGRIQQYIDNAITKTENWKLYDLIKTYLQTKAKIIKGRDYIIENGKIVRIGETGRKEQNSHFDYVINTFLELMNGIEVTKKPVVTKGMSYPVFYNKFPKLCGMSATLDAYAKDFNIIYGKDIKRIKPHNKSRLIENPPYVCNSDMAKVNIIREIVAKHINRPIIIICKSDNEVVQVSEALKEQTDGRKLMVINNYNLEDEAELIEAFQSEPDAILISTVILGRGVDITPKNEVNDHGGILLISLTLYKYAATDRQIAGRVARNGQRGEIHRIVSLEDEIFTIVWASQKKKIASPRTKSHQVIRLIKKSRVTFEHTEFTNRHFDFLLENDIEKRVGKIIEPYQGIERVNLLHTLYLYVSLCRQDLRNLRTTYHLADPQTASHYVKEYNAILTEAFQDAIEFAYSHNGISNIGKEKIYDYQ